jgi:hypothetical protein
VSRTGPAARRVAALPSPVAAAAAAAAAGSAAELGRCGGWCGGGWGREVRRSAAGSSLRCRGTLAGEGGLDGAGTGSVREGSGPCPLQRAARLPSRPAARYPTQGDSDLAAPPPGCRRRRRPSLESAPSDGLQRYTRLGSGPGYRKGQFIAPSTVACLYPRLSSQPKPKGSPET